MRALQLFAVLALAGVVSPNPLDSLASLEPVVLLEEAAQKTAPPKKPVAAEAKPVAEAAAKKGAAAAKKGNEEASPQPPKKAAPKKPEKEQAAAEEVVAAQAKAAQAEKQAIELKLEDKQPSPFAEPEFMYEEGKTKQQLEDEVKISASKRDQYWKEWDAAREACGTLREENRDMESEVLTQGRMILLALEMKLAVEKKKNLLKKGETPPDKEYSDIIASRRTSQKQWFGDMMVNRRAADDVCAKQKQLEARYKEYVGKYEKASVHLRWRLAHGCFHAGLSHYCVHVQKWCGKGHHTHPCITKATMSPAPAEVPQKNEAKSEAPKPQKDAPEQGKDEQKGKKETGAAPAEKGTEKDSPKAAAVSLLQYPTPHHTLHTMKRAVREAVWPKEDFCFDDVQSSLQHCAKVTRWQAPTLDSLAPSTTQLQPAMVPQIVELHSSMTTGD